MSEDNWHYHFYDTVKGSDWLGDQDAIEFMCREAPKVVYELEHMGMPFDRNPDGTIYQRPFGGHTANYGEKPVQRACAAADRTGHAMLHTLYQQNVKARTSFFVEWMALDLIRDADGDVVGVTAMEMETGDVYVLEAKTTLLATGGAGRILRPAPMPSSTPATAWAWPRARAFRWKTWSSGSSTPPAWLAPACC
jgi:succinate dehydrogenase / fumarate reductase, flavoprotein subunit